MQGKIRHLSEVNLRPRSQSQFRSWKGKRMGVCQRNILRPRKRTAPKHQKNKKKEMRHHKEPHQVLPNNNKARPRVRSYTLGVCKKRPRHTRSRQNIQSLRMTQTSWPKESMTEKLRSLKTPNTKGTEFRMS
jgi:hypothetical protein